MYAVKIRFASTLAIVALGTLSCGVPTIERGVRESYTAAVTTKGSVACFDVNDAVKKLAPVAPKLYAKLKNLSSDEVKHLAIQMGKDALGHTVFFKKFGVFMGACDNGNIARVNHLVKIEKFEFNPVNKNVRMYVVVELVPQQPVSRTWADIPLAGENEVPALARALLVAVNKVPTI